MNLRKLEGTWQGHEHVDSDGATRRQWSLHTRSRSRAGGGEKFGVSAICGGKIGHVCQVQLHEERLRQAGTSVLQLCKSMTQPLNIT